VNCVSSSYDDVVTSLFTCTVDTVSSFFSYFYNLIIFYSLLLANYTYFLISFYHVDTVSSFFSYFYNLIIFYSLLLANYTYLLISIYHS